jgi:hypothetical protein
MERIMDVQFPEQALDTNGKDVLVPLKELQQGLGILPDDTDLAKSGVAARLPGHRTASLLSRQARPLYPNGGQ